MKSLVQAGCLLHLCSCFAPPSPPPKRMWTCGQKVVLESLSASLTSRTWKKPLLLLLGVYPHMTLFTDWTEPTYYVIMACYWSASRISLTVLLLQLHHTCFSCCLNSADSLLLPTSVPSLIWAEEGACIKFSVQQQKDSFASCSSNEKMNCCAST